jgi:hypothetical protein
VNIYDKAQPRRNNSLQLILRPTDRHGQFEALLDGRRLCVSRHPILDAARILIAQGLPPDSILSAFHDGAELQCIRARLGTAARLTVRENDKRGPDFVAYEPFPSVRVASPMRQSGLDGKMIVGESAPL